MMRFPLLLQFTRPPFSGWNHALVFLALAYATLISLSVEGLEQTHGGTSCDNSCHNGHHDEEYESYIVVSSLVVPELEVGEEGTILAEIWNDAEGIRDQYTRYERVDYILSTENDTLEIDNPSDYIINLREGEGNSRILEWSVTGSQAGSDTLILLLDGSNDHDDGFNVLTDARQPFQVTTERADVMLAENDIELNPTAPIQGQATTLDVVLQNLGGNAMCNLALYIDEENVQGLLERKVGLILENGANLDLNFSFETANQELGSHTLILQAENISPADSNLGNHRLEVPLQLLERGNLQVTGLTAAPTSPMVSDTATVTINVWNEAPYSIDTFLRLTLVNPFGNSSQETEVALSLSPEDIVPVQVEWTIDLPYPSPGTSILEAHIDPGNNIPETDDDDNNFSIEVTVRARIPPVEFQLLANATVVEPMPLLEGDVVLIRVAIANLGLETGHSNLTAILYPETGLPVTLGRLPLEIASGGYIEALLDWNTHGWLGEVQLVLEVDAHPEEDRLDNNQLTLELQVYSPPSLFFASETLILQPIPVAEHFPVWLEVELSELNHTPVAGHLWLIMSDGNRTGTEFVMEGGETQILNLTFLPLPGEETYRLEVEAPGSANELEFDLLSLAPEEQLQLSSVTLSHLAPRAETPITITLLTEWELSFSHQVRLELWLDPDNDISHQLFDRQFTLQPGNNTISWSGLLPAGEHIIEMRGVLLLEEENLTLEPKRIAFVVGSSSAEATVVFTPGLIIATAVTGVFLGGALFLSRK